MIMMRLTSFLVAGAVLGSLVQLACSDELWDSLNGVQQLMTGKKDFDKGFYDSLITCLNELDPKLLESVNAQWAGFKAYAQSGGDPGVDDWERCPESKWFERNCTVQEYGDIPIWEPCNYASNIAYYHTTVEICARLQNDSKWHLPDESVKAIGKAFASLGLGSSFLHGSQTDVGGSSDVRVNDLFGWIIYQEMVKKLKAGNHSIVHELAYSPRSLSAVEAVDKLMITYIEKPVKEWGRILEETDFPKLRDTMCGLFGTALTLAFPENVVDGAVDQLLNLFAGFDEEMKEFCQENFLPQIQIATEAMRPLPAEEASQLKWNLIGTTMKLIYAFVWQEEALVSLSTLTQPGANGIGAMILPGFNRVASAFTNFGKSQTFDQSGKGFYPGDEVCNSWDPHAKWHLETAIGLIDMISLSDEIYKLIDKYST